MTRKGISFANGRFVRSIAGSDLLREIGRPDQRGRELADHAGPGAATAFTQHVVVDEAGAQREHHVAIGEGDHLDERDADRRQVAEGVTGRVADVKRHALQGQAVLARIPAVGDAERAIGAHHAAAPSTGAETSRTCGAGASTPSGTYPAISSGERAFGQASMSVAVRFAIAG